MNVVCTGAHEGLDGLPTVLSVKGVMLHGGCGEAFDIDPTDYEGRGWDTMTDRDGNVVRRHRGVTCPACSVVTFVVCEE